MSDSRSFSTMGRLLLVLFLLMILHPFIRQVALMTTLVSVVLTATVFSVTTHRRDRIVVGTLGALYIVAGFKMGLGDHATTTVVAANGIGILFFGGALWFLLRAVFRTDIVDHNALFGAASIYLLFSVLAARAFLIVEILRPGAFVATGTDPVLTWLDFQYFSLVTLTTLGFGDIQPVHPVARSLTVFVAVCGVFYMAFLVARLVAVHSTNKERTGS